MRGGDVMRAGRAGTLTLLHLLLLLASLVSHAGCEDVWCYECGTGVAGRPDCEDFVRASSWTHFWRKCAPDSVCVKTKPAWDPDKLEQQTVRGCSPGTSLQGAKHLDGCWTHPTLSSALTCYCYTSLCNAAHPTPTPPALLLALAVGASWAVWFM